MSQVNADSASAPQVSVVVPTYNSARTLRRCLLSVRSQHGVTTQVIVVDPLIGSRDATASIAADLADLFIVEGTERSTQRNAGLALATAPVVAFVDSDMVLTDGVLAEAHALLTSLSSSRKVHGVVLSEQVEGIGIFAKARAMEKDIYARDPMASAARVFRTEEVHAVSGFDPSLLAAEDFDLSDRVAGSGPLPHTTNSVIHLEGRISLAAQWSKKRYYGRSLLDYARRSPEGRRRFRRTSLLMLPRLFLTRPIVTSALMILKATEFTGLVIGFLAPPKDPENYRQRVYSV